MCLCRRLGGVVVATGPKGREFKPDRGDEFLKQSRAVPLHAMVALGGEEV
jgi:hypothetical protein